MSLDTLPNFPGFRAECRSPRDGAIPGIRTARTTIMFAAPFRLKGVDFRQAAGSYKIETVDEIVQVKGRLLSRPTSTRIHLRVAGSIRIRAVDRLDLGAALKADREMARSRARGLA